MKAARGFRYELEPLRRQRAMELDEARARLAEALSRLAAARERRESLEVRFAAARAEWSRRQEGLSLQFQRLAATYLRDLGKLIIDCTVEIERQETLRGEAAANAMEAHRALEVVEKHRDGEVREHLRGLDRKGFAEADESFVQRFTPREDVA
jgi:flagellar biosynthesis chaperone FliJ